MDDENSVAEETYYEYRNDELAQQAQYRVIDTISDHISEELKKVRLKIKGAQQALDPVAIERWTTVEIALLDLLGYVVCSAYGDSQ